MRLPPNRHDKIDAGLEKIYQNPEFHRAISGSESCRHLGNSVRAWNVLAIAGISSFGELRRMTAARWLEIPGCGPKVLNQIAEWARQFNIRVKIPKCYRKP